MDETLITKKEIINVLLDYGLSPIESDRCIENKESFEVAIQSIIEQARSESH